MRRAVALAFAGLIATIPLVAEAHGPVRKKVTETVTIAAPPEKVWAVIGDFQDMSWYPGIAKTEGKGGNTVVSDADDSLNPSRHLTLAGGGTIDEVLYKYSAEKMSYSYRITTVDVKVLPVTNYAATLSVLPGEAAGTSTVEWKGAFYRGYPNNDPPPELDDDAAVAAVTKLYRTGLDALKAKVEKGS
ncbi:SRPBCC family protein [Zavarzinia sp.]|uniref:SRPBCC family protein n=1 Tax=Zavarzinia sp. TaxID=2027920 RepID=UPI003564349B